MYNANELKQIANNKIEILNVINIITTACKYEAEQGKTRCYFPCVYHYDLNNIELSDVTIDFNVASFKNISYDNLVLELNKLGFHVEGQQLLDKKGLFCVSW